ncbi:hypothetical protein JW948_08350 [bacterium]|nr:hypothetical protein [bacterium]
MFKLHYDKKRNCLIGVYNGMYSREIFQACVSKIRFAIDQYECHCFVMDMRQADMEPSMVNFKYCYTVLFEAGFDETWKKAVLLSPEGYESVPDIQRMSDQPDMHLFGNVNDAAKWLFG